MEFKMSDIFVGPIVPLLLTICTFGRFIFIKVNPRKFHIIYFTKTWGNCYDITQNLERESK